MKTYCRLPEILRLYSMNLMHQVDECAIWMCCWLMLRTSFVISNIIIWPLGSDKTLCNATAHRMNKVITINYPLIVVKAKLSLGSRDYCHTRIITVSYQLFVLINGEIQPALWDEACVYRPAATTIHVLPAVGLALAEAWRGRLEAGVVGVFPSSQCRQGHHSYFCILNDLALEQ